MSDEPTLIERLRDPLWTSNGNYPEWLADANVATMSEAADRLESLEAQVKRVTAPFRNVDKADWEFIHDKLYDAGAYSGGDERARFWKTVLVEVRVALRTASQLPPMGKASEGGGSNGVDAARPRDGSAIAQERDEVKVAEICTTCGKPIPDGEVYDNRRGDPSRKGPWHKLCIPPRIGSAIGCADEGGV